LENLILLLLILVAVFVPVAFITGAAKSLSA
jgi:multidrug efflux pump subunit AcrB